MGADVSKNLLRTYQGRVLARQDEDVEDQGLEFDVTTLVGRQRSSGLLGRRQLLTLGGAGVAAFGLAACGSTATAVSASTASTATGANLTEFPDQTAGPYPADGTNGPDTLEESGIVRKDIRSSFGTSTTTAEGIPMTLRLSIYDLANGGAAYEGAAVYIWHCDRDGLYSLYSEGVEDENYLRGVQVADADGLVEFTSIYPACYAGRWPHIHFEIYPDVASITDAANNISTSQLALPGDVSDAVYATAGYEASVTNKSVLSLETDGVFSRDTEGAQLAKATGDVTSGYVVTLPIGVDATTAVVAEEPGGGAGGFPTDMPSGGPPSGFPTDMPSGMTPPSGAPTSSATATS